MNDERRPATSAAANSDESEVSTGLGPTESGEPEIPALVVVIPYEGRPAAVIRGCRDEEATVSLRAWLNSDPDFRQFCQVLRRILERRDPPSLRRFRVRRRGGVLLTARQRRVISTRTKVGLEQARARGVRLGRPSNVPAEVRARIVERRAAGLTLAAIAAELNEAEIATAQGGRAWYPSSVAVVLKRERGDA